MANNENRVVVSFKSTEEEQAMLKEIKNSSDKSAYVKERLKENKRLKQEIEELKSSMNNKGRGSRLSGGPVF